MSTLPAAVASARSGAPRYRRSDYDVTNTVQVSSVAGTRVAVEALYMSQWPEASFAPVSAAFDFMDRSAASAKEWGLSNLAAKFEKNNKELSASVNNFVNSD